MTWRPENTTKEEIGAGKDLLVQYQILKPDVLTSCSTCHR